MRPQSAKLQTIQSMKIQCRRSSGGIEEKLKFLTQNIRRIIGLVGNVLL